MATAAPVADATDCGRGGGIPRDRSRAGTGGGGGGRRCQLKGSSVT